ncbi:hypothetical protein ACFYPN_23945 [Streptomyces sp. NPDC005576]|uniref:hypothetical protein n=1 Tax=unclassified Streptomyces TaxID=2593676 RepID=UPI003403A3A4
MNRSLVPLRTALIFLLAVLSGVTAGGLSWLAGEGSPRSALAALGVAGLAIPFFDRLIASAESGDVRTEDRDHG